MPQEFEARVFQKATTLANWMANPLIIGKGEQAFVMSGVDDAPVIFKVGIGTKRFSDLPWPDFTVRSKLNPIADMTGLPSGIYLPVSNGAYGSVTVTLSDGYQVIHWDGTTAVKVVYPSDLAGYVSRTEFNDTLNQINQLDIGHGKNYYDKSRVRPGWSLNATFQLVSGLDPASYSVTPFSGKEGVTYTISGSIGAPQFSRIRFEKADGTFISGYDPNANGVTALPFSFTFPTGAVRAIVNTRNGVANSSDYSTIQIEVGPASPYEAYKAVIGQTSLDLAGYDKTADLDNRYVATTNLSKNLLNVNARIEGAAINGSFDIQTVGPGSPFSYVVVKDGVVGGAEYTYQGVMDGFGSARVRFESAPGVACSPVKGYDPAGVGSPMFFTIPADCTQFLVTTRAGSSVSYSTLQVEAGHGATGVVPYGKFIPDEVLSPNIARVTDIQSFWKGKTIVIYGDSQVAINLWPPKLAALLGCSVIIRGVGGSCVTPGFGDFPNNSLNEAGRMAQVEADMATADLLLICAGGNDCIQNVPIGLPGSGSPFSQGSVPTDFYTAWKRLLNYFQTSPNAKSKPMAVIGLLHTHGTIADRYANYTHNALYADATIGACGEMGVPVMDSLRKYGITRENETIYQVDGTHLNDLGAVQYARKTGSYVNTL